MTQINVGFVKDKLVHSPNFSDCFLDKTLELERKFPFRDESEKFSDLVNFSKNYSVPFYRWARYREGYSGELVKELILYPYPLSRQKTEEFKIDSPPIVTAVGTQGARRATGVPTATP